MHARTLLRADGGAAMVEFALVLPLLLVLVFGMVDFGRAINYWIDETHLANEGARFAAVGRNPGDASGQTLQEWLRAQAVTDELETGNSDSVADPLRVCLSFPAGAPRVGDPVRVEISTTFNWLPFLDSQLATFLGTPSITETDIVGSSTMRLEARADNFDTGLSEGCTT